MRTPSDSYHSRQEYTNKRYLVANDLLATFGAASGFSLARMGSSAHSQLVDSQVTTLAEMRAQEARLREIWVQQRFNGFAEENNYWWEEELQSLLNAQEATLKEGLQALEKITIPLEFKRSWKGKTLQEKLSLLVYGDLLDQCEQYRTLKRIEGINERTERINAELRLLKQQTEGKLKDVMATLTALHFLDQARRKKLSDHLNVETINQIIDSKDKASISENLAHYNRVNSQRKQLSLKELQTAIEALTSARNAVLAEVAGSFEIEENQGETSQRVATAIS